MTESEWLAALEPGPMLAFLRDKQGESPRKLRLLDCACVRRIWHLVTDERCRKAVETAARFADGLASLDELAEMRTAAAEVTTDAASAWDAAQPADSHYFAGAFSDASDAAAYAVTWLCAVKDKDHFGTFVLDSSAFATGSASVERLAQSALVRDIFGPLPFRSITIDPSLLSWNNGAIERLAQVIYEERSFELMPILADSLESAGCYDEDILRHCRAQGSIHVRGCWVVDLLLGRE